MSALWLILACTFGEAQPADKNTAQPAVKNAAPGPSVLAPIVIDYAMDSDPQLDGFKSKQVFSEKYLPLWLQALDRPEADLQRLAAATVALAHQQGAPEMAQAKPALLRILEARQTQPASRQAAARALLVLDAKEGAPQLWQAAQTGGAEVRLIVEPGLAR